MLINTQKRKLIAVLAAAATTLELPIEIYARQTGSLERNPIANWLYTKGTTPVDIIGGSNDTGMSVTIEEMNIYNRDTAAARIQIYAVDEPIAATAIVAGKTYQIASVGSTNFVAIGAAANTVGLLFVATGTGTGTGTAGICFQTWDMILQVDDTLCYSINAGWRVLDGNGQTKMSMPGYALLAGSATQVFSVAPATAAAHAVRLDQFPASIASSGYQKLSSGLIVQWGSATVTAGTLTVVTPPIPFPTLGLILTTQLIGNATTTTQYSGGNYSTNIAGSTQISLSVSAGTFGVHWIAIGH